MGLFAGISVISLFEVGFFIIQTIVARLIDLRNRRSVHEITNVVPKYPVTSSKTVFSKCKVFYFAIMDKSSIHGLHYIVKKKKSIFFKLFWLVIVLASSAFCFLEIFKIIKHSEVNPIEYAMDQKIWDLKNVIIFLKESSSVTNLFFRRFHFHK